MVHSGLRVALFVNSETHATTATRCRRCEPRRVARTFRRDWLVASVISRDITLTRSRAQVCGHDKVARKRV